VRDQVFAGGADRGQRGHRPPPDVEVDHEAVGPAVAEDHLAVLLEPRLRRGERHHVEQLQDEVGVIQLLGALDAQLAAQFAQFLQAPGLKLGEVPALIGLVALAGEWPGEDRRVAAGRVVVSATLEDRPRRLAPGASAIGSAPRSAAPLGAGIVVHDRLGCGISVMDGLWPRKEWGLDSKGRSPARFHGIPRSGVSLSSGERAGG